MTSDLVESLLIESINDKYDCLFRDIVEKYGSNKFTIEDLQIYKVKCFKTVNSYTKPIVSKNNFDYNSDKCIARIWGGPCAPRVKFNRELSKWEYGLQCSRYKDEDHVLCKMHQKKNPHGTIFTDPPHDNFKKYQLKIEKKNMK